MQRIFLALSVLTMFVTAGAGTAAASAAAPTHAGVTGGPCATCWFS